MDRVTPITIYLLVAAYGWSVYKAIRLLIRGISFEQKLLASVGFEWLFYILMVLAVALSVAACRSGMCAATQSSGTAM